MLKPRIIKNKSCPRCRIYLKTLARQKYDHLIFDADLEENQKELDEWRINTMPVVQIVDVKDDGTQKMVFQFPPAPISPRQIDTQIKILNKQRGTK